jgi:hypothetical protein
MSSNVKIHLYIDIYNTHVIYLTFIILLTMADVKACFHSPQIHADLTGTFGFLARGYFNLATACPAHGNNLYGQWRKYICIR